MATQEIGLNEAHAGHGIAAWETDVAELMSRPMKVPQAA